VAKQLALFVLIGYLFLLTALSLIKISKLPTLGSSFDDKIFHFLSYLILTSLCYNYFNKTTISKPILVSFVTSVSYGVLIEGLQNITSIFRTADIYDILANVLGTVFAIIFISISKNVKLK
jgi:VanZ family protein